jgi:hypothetical protein
MAILNTLKPDLAPVRVYAARAEAPVFGVTRLANDAVQDDALVLHMAHLTGAFIDNFIDPSQHSIGAPAEGCHLGVEKHAPVVAVLIDGRKNLFIRLDSDQIARLNAKFDGGGWGAAHDFARADGVWR